MQGGLVELITLTREGAANISMPPDYLRYQSMMSLLFCTSSCPAMDFVKFNW